MLILAIDSAAGSCRACVWQDGNVLAEREEHMERGQDQRLMPMILDLLKTTKIDFSSLDRIAITRGPGSFTGLRIGLAAARGIGFAAQKPVIGIDRFAIYREQHKNLNKNLLVAIESKRKELFCQYFSVDGSAEKPSMMDEKEIEGFLKNKENTVRVGDQNKASFNEAVTCAALADKADINDPSYLPRPLYIRPPDVTVSARPVFISE
ncbi:MAG: tRNA (adenosine(37)-N6)-threonylcarbamoyltransferase complex dimerization subunit type 1 TsaB [Alphaproteobacteria bacterium]